MTLSPKRGGVAYLSRVVTAELTPPKHTLSRRRGGGQPRPSQGPPRPPPPLRDEPRRSKHHRDKQRRPPDGHERPPGPGRGPQGPPGRPPPQQKDVKRGFRVPLLPRLKLNFRTQKGTRLHVVRERKENCTLFFFSSRSNRVLFVFSLLTSSRPTPPPGLQEAYCRNSWEVVVVMQVLVVVGGRRARRSSLCIFS